MAWVDGFGGMSHICQYCGGLKWVCEEKYCPSSRRFEEHRLQEARRIRSPRSEYRHSRTHCSLTGMRFLVRCCELRAEPDAPTPDAP